MKKGIFVVSVICLLISLTASVYSFARWGEDYIFILGVLFFGGVSAIVKLSKEKWLYNSIIYLISFLFCVWGVYTGIPSDVVIGIAILVLYIVIRILVQFTKDKTS